jgi:hypothetical protein
LLSPAQADDAFPQVNRACRAQHDESDEDDFVGCKVLDPDGYEIEIYWEA